MNEAIIKEIVKSKDYRNMIPIDKHPDPGEYVITSIQSGNIDGEKGWHLYVGYVVQVRKKAGAYGTDLVILRHPDGTLMQHHNQTFIRMNKFYLEKLKEQYPKGMNKWSGLIGQIF